MKRVNMTLDDDLYYGLLQLKAIKKVDTWEDLVKKVLEEYKLGGK